MSQQARESRREIQQGDIVHVDNSQTDDFNPDAYGVSVHGEYRVVRIEPDGSLYLHRSDGSGSEIGPVRGCFFERVLRPETSTISSKTEGKKRPVFLENTPPEIPAILPIDLPCWFAQKQLTMVSLREAIEKKFTIIDPRALSPYRRLISILVRICYSDDFQFRLVAPLSSPSSSSYVALRSIEKKMGIHAQPFDALESELIRFTFTKMIKMYDSYFSSAAQ